MIKKIEDAVLELLEKIDPFNPFVRDDNVVIIISRKSFSILQADIARDNHVHFIYGVPNFKYYFIHLLGKRIPIVIDYSLPQNIEFQVMRQSDYERMEEDRLTEKFAQMFGCDNKW